LNTVPAIVKRRKSSGGTARSEAGLSLHDDEKSEAAVLHFSVAFGIIVVPNKSMILTKSVYFCLPAKTQALFHMLLV